MLVNADACVNFAFEMPNFVDVGEGLKMAKLYGRPLWMAPFFITISIIPCMQDTFARARDDTVSCIIP